MTHPHAPQGNRPVGFGGGGISGLVGPGSNLSATPAVPAQAPGVLGGIVPGPGPVAQAPAVRGSLGGVLANAVQRSSAALPIAAPPVAAPVAPAAPALDPITSARSRQFTDGFNPRSLF